MQRNSYLYLRLTLNLAERRLQANDWKSSRATRVNKLEDEVAQSEPALKLWNLTAQRTKEHIYEK